MARSAAIGGAGLGLLQLSSGTHAAQSDGVGAANPSGATSVALGDERVREFRIRVPEAALTDLRRRLVATRWPDRETVADTSQGVQLARLQALCAHWATAYDWRKLEKRLNALPQFITQIDGVDIHFIHVRSGNANALPLLMTHGWPGSILEMVGTIGPLTHPEAHGGRAEDAFDVVIPSIPGYGFSGKPREPGWGPERIGRAWDVLMKRLGHERYVAQGGDHGSVISDAMARQKPPGLLAIHVNMPPTVPAEHVRGINAGDPPPPGLSESERLAFETLARFFARNAAYGALMVTRPQTIGYGLCDSPATLAAFLYEKIYEWTDSDGDPERVLTRDGILDNITLYWLTDTGASASRFYWENNNNNFSSAAQKTTEITIPVAVTVFPHEIYRAPKSWTQRAYPTLCYFNEVAKGGHFAAWEQPELFASEMRAAFKPVRERPSRD
ncbi:multidrug MFS transporter [Piscinibacter gummiphilus]|uniref:Multidrug MFS transporter n=1 Tax=Piscinibacter gummiphilus TaxID=946333 RepID=A0A1W6LHI1_9BURK|nr:multidrug MFS transporter [Piscinibacter gummiphilus]